MLTYKVHEALQGILANEIPAWVEQNLASCTSKGLQVRLVKGLKQSANIVLRAPVSVKGNDLFRFFYLPEEYLSVQVTHEDKMHIQRHMRPVYDEIANKIIYYYSINTHENNMVMLDGFQSLSTTAGQAQRYFTDNFKDLAKVWWEKKLSRDQRSYLEKYFQELNSDQIDCLKRNVVFFHPELELRPSEVLLPDCISYYYLGHGFAKLDSFLLPTSEGYIDAALQFSFPEREVVFSFIELPSIWGNLCQLIKRKIK